MSKTDKKLEKSGTFKPAVKGIRVASGNFLKESAEALGVGNIFGTNTDDKKDKDKETDKEVDESIGSTVLYELEELKSISSNFLNIIDQTKKELDEGAKEVNTKIKKNSRYFIR